jgi:hypothetical protein
MWKRSARQWKGTAITSRYGLDRTGEVLPWRLLQQGLSDKDLLPILQALSQHQGVKLTRSTVKLISTRLSRRPVHAMQVIEELMELFPDGDWSAFDGRRSGHDEDYGELQLMDPWGLDASSGATRAGALGESDHSLRNGSGALSRESSNGRHGVDEHQSSNGVGSGAHSSREGFRMGASRPGSNGSLRGDQSEAGKQQGEGRADVGADTQHQQSNLLYFQHLATHSHSDAAAHSAETTAQGGWWS